MADPTEIFEQNLPEIAQSDAVGAAKAERIVQSFNTHPISSPNGTIPALAIKLKFSNGTTETVLIGQYAARVLRLIFSHLEENKWTELASLPPGTTPQ
jgi:hypothetical protein